MFIAPLDADDLWHPEKIAKQVECFRGHKKCGRPVGMVYCWSQNIDEQSRVMRPVVPRKPIEGQVFKRLLVENFLGNGSTPLIAKSALDQVGLYLETRDANGCEDWSLYLRIAREFEVYGVGEYLVGYRRFESSMSANYRKMLLAHDALIDDLMTHSEGFQLAHVRNSRTSLLLWMIAGERFGSEKFRFLFHELWGNDPLFLVRGVPARLIYLMLRTRVFRLLGIVAGNKVPGSLYLANG